MGEKLIKGENIIIRTNRSNWLIFNQLLLLLAIIAYFCFLYFFIYLTIIDAYRAVLPFIGLWLIFFIREILHDRSRLFLITNKRLVSKRDELSLQQIRGIFIHRHVLGRIGKYGDIIIHADKYYYYRAISHPEIVMENLNKELKRGIKS